MKLRVQNAGPIRDAELDLGRPITVLTGPNGTGKTWFGWVVYTMCQPEFFLTRNSPTCDALVAQLLASPNLRIDLADGLWPVLAGVVDDIVGALSTVLGDSFSVDADLFSSTRVAVDVSSSRRVKQQVWHYNALSDGTLIEVEIQFNAILLTLSRGTALPQGSPVEQVIHGDFGQPPQWTNVKLQELGDQQLEELRARSRRAINSIAFHMVRSHGLAIFPVERLSIQNFAKELLLARMQMVDHMDSSLPFSIRPKIPRYPWPIRDNLYIAADLSNIAKVRSEYADIADYLEHEVLRGQVSVTSDNELNFSPGGAPNITFAVSAAVIKSLSSIVFYFRHRANKGDLMIIDEPELGLHPDNQRKVARALVRAAHRGIRVMMSTHSDWVLRELSCLLMASRLSAEEQAELGIAPEETLRAEDIGCYLFRADGGTEEVIPDEYGLNIKTIEEETHKLHDLEQKLYLKLHG